MKTKSMAYNRDVSFRKAIHRRRISRYWCWRPSYGDYYNNLHQYSKNKIHCSCPLCRGESFKTKKEEILTRELLKDELDF